MANKSEVDSESRPITEPISGLLRLPAGKVEMRRLDPGATPGFPGVKRDTRTITAALAPELSDLQERLYAAGRQVRRSWSCCREWTHQEKVE
jgi:hypothetical protein